MIARDTDILFYAHREDSEWHPAAAACVEALAEGRAAWAIPRPCVHASLAIVTHTRIFSPPSPLLAALDQLAAWLESPSTAAIGEEDGYREVLRTLLAASRVSGPAVHDARIARVVQTARGSGTVVCGPGFRTAQGTEGRESAARLSARGSREAAQADGGAQAVGMRVSRRRRAAPDGNRRIRRA